MSYTLRTPTSQDGPATKAFAITPNDGADLAVPTRCLYVGTAGNVSVILAEDSAAVTITNLAVGYHPLQIKRLRASGTTAAGLVGLA
jgi:hypothetical protein